MGQCAATLMQHIADRYFRAGGHQCARKRFTESARATGDQHTAAIEANVVVCRHGQVHATRFAALGR